MSPPTLPPSLEILTPPLALGSYNLMVAPSGDALCLSEVPCDTYRPGESQLRLDSMQCEHNLGQYKPTSHDDILMPLFSNSFNGLLTSKRVPIYF